MGLQVIFTNILETKTFVQISPPPLLKEDLLAGGFLAHFLQTGSSAPRLCDRLQVPLTR